MNSLYLGFFVPAQRKTLMRKSISTLIVFVFILTTALVAQVPLNTFVGPTSMPSDDDAICTIPIYPDVTTNLEGPLEGELVHDFKLYTLDGDSVQLSGVLNDGKPILLIGCNYTCYVFRGKIDVINEMQAMYGDLINILLMYTVEAHPVIDFSPYFGYENVGADNYAEGILYRQPLTYGERKLIVSDMLANEDIDVPVLIDGPCNDVWMNYGTAPNPAWLIAPDGIVYDAQKWFNKEPENMYASIDELLGIVGTGTYTPEGTFDAEDEGEDIYYGTVDNMIAAHITFTNTSDDNVLIDFVRESEDIPAGWYTSLCTELCYSPSVDSTTVYLTPGQSEEVRIDFFTDGTPAEGSVTLSCTNHYDPTNNYSFTINASSIAATDIENNQIHFTTLFPNPATAGSVIHFDDIHGVDAIPVLFGMDGKPIANLTKLNSGDYILPDVATGLYYIQIIAENNIYLSSVTITN